MDNESTAAVKNCAQVIERSTDVDVCQVDMPMVVWSEWLCKSIAFGCLLCVPSIQQVSGFEHAVGCRRAHGHDVSVHHHVRGAAVALERIFGAKFDDCCSLLFSQPVVARDQGVVLVCFSKSLFPVKVLAGCDSYPGNKRLGSDASFVFPSSDVVDDFIADVVGNPLSV